jgi:hypothetical protein
MSDNKVDIYDVSNLSEDQQRGALVFLARIFETAERYDDMAAVMKKLVQWVSGKKSFLTVEERNLLSVAYKNVIGFRRSAWRSFNETSISTTVVQESFNSLIARARQKVEQELDSICAEVISVLTDYLIDNDA